MENYKRLQESLAQNSLRDTYYIYKYAYIKQRLWIHDIPMSAPAQWRHRGPTIFQTHFTSTLERAMMHATASMIRSS